MTTAYDPHADWRREDREPQALEFSLRDLGVRQHLTTLGYLPPVRTFEIVHVKSGRIAWTGSSSDTAKRMTSYLNGLGWTR